MRDIPRRIDVTIERATDTWLSKYSSANTRAAHSSDLRAFLSWFGDDSSALDVTPEAISEHRAERGVVGRQLAIDDIRQTMGHRDVRTTRRYLEPSGSERPHS